MVKHLTQGGDEYRPVWGCLRKETADLPRLFPQCLLYFLLARCSPPRPLHPPPRVILSQHSRIQPPGSRGEAAQQEPPGLCRAPPVPGCSHTRTPGRWGTVLAGAAAAHATPGVPCSWELSLVNAQVLEDENGVPSLNSASPMRPPGPFQVLQVKT